MNGDDSAREVVIAAAFEAGVFHHPEQLFLIGEAQGLGALDDSAVIRVVAPRLRTAPADGSQASPRSEA